MPNTMIDKLMIKYSLFFETVCFMFAAGSIVGILSETYFLFIKENWFLGSYRTLNIFLLEFFTLSFVIGCAAKAGFAVIRKATRAGQLKI